jgi:hypothetical protein
MTARYITKALLRELASQLSDQDEAVIARVSALRFVSGEQLARMHFEGSARATRRALSRLVQLDCLARLPRRIGGGSNGSKSFVYLLAPTGQRLAMERGWLPRRRTRRPHIPGTLFVDHALQVAELHTLLTEADRARRIELLQLNSDSPWRCYGGAAGPKRILKPDSYVRLGVGEYEDSYFIEVDMGTEGSRALAGKLRQTAEYKATGLEQAKHGVFPLTVWLTPDAKRAADIEACIERLPPSAQRLFLVTPFDKWDVTHGRKIETTASHTK